jgi:hypothetical protein
MLERLSDNTAVSLIVRLLVDRQAHIVSGEVKVLNADERRQRKLRFRGSDGLVEAVASVARAAVSGTHQDTG